MLTKITKKDLLDYICICNKFLYLNTNNFFDLSVNSIKYYIGNREKLREFQILENIWYDSLIENEPDYSIYNNPNYLADLWACWVVYSSKYLKLIKSKIDLFKDIDIINDLGCGFGYTTASLKFLFPEAKVYGTNIENTHQYNIAKYYSEKYNFEVIPSIFKTNKSNLIVAFEYFEHFERPIEHLLFIIKSNEPKYFIIANSFNAKSIGHFNFYYFNNKKYTGKEISIIFNKTLRNYGYEVVKTGFWNNRPIIWEKTIDESLKLF